VASKIVDNGAPVHLNISGNGAVYLSNAGNSFSGNIYLNGGILALAADGALGGTNTIYAVGGAGSIIRADLGTVNPWTTNHSISIADGAYLDICSQSGPITINASVKGSGVLGIGMSTYNQGTGVNLPTDQNGFTGTYVVGNRLRADEGVGLSTNANLALATMNLYGSGGTLETASDLYRTLGAGPGQVQFGQSQNNSWGGGFSAVGTAGANPVTISLGGAGTPLALTHGEVGFFTGKGDMGYRYCSLYLQNGNANNTLTWANPINNNGYIFAVYQAATGGEATKATMTGVISGSGGFLKQGGGLLEFGAANTYSGITQLSAGTLALGNTNALQNSTLDQGLAGSQLLTLAVSGTNSYNLGGLRGTNNIALGANTLVIGSNNSTNTYWGTLSGLGGGLVKTGTGVMTLSGTNTYTGATVAQSGVLELIRTNALSAATALDIRSGAEVRLSFTGTNVIDSLTVNGVTSLRGVYAAGSVPGLTGSAGAYLQTLQPPPRGTMIRVF
jgi:fibronectin-binding autotransporter adhesin